MNRTLAVVLLVVGILLLIWGFNASGSLASDVSETVTGAPTDRSIVLIVLGAAASIAGAFGLMRRRA